MRVKFYFLAVSLCCMLPCMTQGADLENKSPPGPPRAALRSMPSIIVETESGMFTLHFISDLGEVNILLQEVTGTAEYRQQVDTSVQNQAIFLTPAGTYTLTITDTAGNIINQESILIP